MDNQDKIFDKFKKAAQNDELKDFSGMEKVWSRVEDKLDKKEDKKTIALWKKIAIAASLLLLISLGSQFLLSDKTKENQNHQVVVTDSVEKQLQNPVVEKDGIAVENSEIVPKEEAVKILDKQIEQQQKVALNEIKVSMTEATGSGTAKEIVPDAVFAPAPVQAAPKYAEEEVSIQEDKNESFGYSKAVQKESAKMAFAEKQASPKKKSAPLVVINGNAMAHSDDAKKDKMLSGELSNLEPSNVDSLVILDEPLYIIDGIYYSENDLYGSNPTSPYAPLDKQEIKTITILQDLEATSKYGEKGKKGVVIITTKTGKPVNKK